MKALVLGATGLVGQEILKQLVANATYSEVRVLVRRKLEERLPGIPGKTEVRVVDFEQLEQSMFAGMDHVYCCLGTTIRQAGSREAFRKVDQDYVVSAARLAARAGARKFLLISSVGANPRSRTFYLKVKGETEAAVGSSGVPEIHLFRPSFLLGKRKGARPLEQFGIALVTPLASLLAGPARRYRPIEAAELARCMIAQALASESPEPNGIRIHEGAGLELLI